VARPAPPPHRRTWWDKQDEPPQALMDWVSAFSQRLARRLGATATGEGKVGSTVTMCLLAGVFLVLVWLLFLGILQQI
jgi:hypothetical protein